MHLPWSRYVHAVTYLVGYRRKFLQIFAKIEKWTLRKPAWRNRVLLRKIDLSMLDSAPRLQLLLLGQKRVMKCNWDDLQ